MVTLALVGAPAAPISYAAFQALQAGGTALAATAGAAKAAALAALASGAALALGAGIGGFLLGEAILAGLEPETSMPDMGEYFEAGVVQGTVRIIFDYYVDGNQVFNDLSSQTITSPVKGIFFKVIDGASVWFVFDGDGVEQRIISTSNKASGTRFDIVSFVTGAGSPVTPTKRLPSYVPKNPDLPKPQPPTPISVPGVPPFPITPVVVPNPGNDEPNDGEERPPGLVVQIPETGQQFRFTPEGVYVTNYGAPNREPFRVPPPVIPPGGKASTPPCCDKDTPEPEPVNLDEIICRLKALQDELLDDGTDRVNGSTPTAQSGFYEELDGGFYKVQMNLVSKPLNAKVQPSTQPASDVIYCGWFAWVENGFPGERVPIHFENQTFLAPPNVTGFMYQYYAAHSGNAQWQRRTKREYIDFCVPADAS